MISTPNTNAVQQIHSLLQDSPYREIRNVKFRFDRDTVTLQGRTSSYYYKQVAQEAVANLECVNRVINLIDVH